jgi:2-keto-4-pentenoate hydratase/2-oxohepta-3-ene-1,7-dioic acid hydratase in catechol pathway
MFSPRDRGLERGWPGRIDGDRVVHLAAQTLQSYFVGGGHAREHAAYPLADVVLRAPVLHPPAVRIFEDSDFRFANPAAVIGPEDVVFLPDGAEEIVPIVRPAAIVDAEGRVGAYTLMVEWTAPALEGQKQRDFALSLGPTAVTEPAGDTDWDRLVAQAARNTRLLPGDVIAAPGAMGDPAAAGTVVTHGGEPFGVLRNRVEART